MVIFACLPFAWVWLLPGAIQEFSKSLILVSTFASNIFFWQTSGYFDTATEFKPLIHTWSLAVEEQYYLFFPVVLMLFLQLGKRRIIGLLAFIFVISFLAAQLFSVTHPSFAFYMLPTRGWELLIGSFIAFYYKHRSIKKYNNKIEQLGGLIGLMLISYSVFAYNDQIPFPGIYSLAPTLGAALIIIFATDKTVIGRLLASKLLVYIGLISYSAYLWHQPLFAFARERSFNKPSIQLMIALTVFSFALAYLSWRYVERPFRNKHRISRNRVLAYGSLCSVLFIGLGFTGYLSNGFEKYWVSTQPIGISNAYTIYQNVNNKSAVYKIENRHDNQDCIFSIENLSEKISYRLQKCYEKYGKGVAILGDSHATNLFDSLFFQNNNRVSFMVGLTKNGCHLPTHKVGCPYDEFLEFVKGNPKIFSIVVYEKAGWLMLRTADGPIGQNLQKLKLDDKVTGVYIDNEVIAGVNDYLRKLSRLVPIVWFGPRIEPQINYKTIVTLGCNYPFFLRQNQYEIYLDLDRQINRININEKGIEYLSQVDLYDFKFPKDFMSCDDTYWIDGDHFSESGEKYFGSRFDFIGFLVKHRGILSETH